MEDLNNYEHLTDNVSFPLIIWNDKNLNPSEKMILVDIIGLVKKKSCFKGNSAFSDLIGVSPDRVSRLLNNLKKRGYINIHLEKTNTNKTKRTISLTVKFRQYILGGLAFSETKIKEENTKKNNGIGENTDTQKEQKVSVKIPIGIGENTVEGIGENTYLRSHIEEVNKEDLNIITETSSGENLEKDLFGENIHPKQIKRNKEKSREKEMTLRQKIIDFWLKEFHPGWDFSKTDGIKINSIIVKLKKSMSFHRDSFSEEDVLNLFIVFCNNLPEYYKNETLSVLESKYFSIIEKIKERKNEKPKQQQRNTSKYSGFGFMSNG